MRAHVQTSVWVETDTEIDSRVTLSYSCLYLGKDVAVFLGYTPAEVLVNVKRLIDELEDIRYRINAE